MTVFFCLHCNPLDLYTFGEIFKVCGLILYKNYWLQQTLVFLNGRLIAKLDSCNLAVLKSDFGDSMTNNCSNPTLSLWFSDWLHQSLQCYFLKLPLISNTGSPL